MNFGIKFVMDNGWHIYWQNPGDSGEPPRIKWQLPAGLTVGALEWPTPMRLTTTAGTDYGYEGTTILLSSLEVPANARTGEMNIIGNLQWLVCHEVCVPQSAELQFPINVASTTIVDESAQKLLRSTAERLPKPPPEHMRPAATKTADGFRLTFMAEKPIKNALFFPIEQEQIDNAAPQELTSGVGKSTLKLAKSDYLRNEPERLRGVLVLNDNDGYQVDVPIQSTPARKGTLHR